MGGIYNKTFKMKIKITEEDRLSILGLHNENYVVNKKVMNEQFNPENGVYYVQNDQGLKASRDFNTVFPKVIKKGTPVYHNYNSKDTKIVLGNTGVVTYCDKNVFIYNDAIDDLKNDGFLNVLKATFCNGNKLKSWTELTNVGKQKEKDPPGSLTDTEKGKVDLSKDPKCKTKNPYNAFTDAGLNWRVERQKWIDVKCNGTTPCILGNAQTNINLRNALCAGTWPLKVDNQTPTTPVTPTTPTTPTTPVTPIVPPTNTTDNSGVVLKQFPELIFGDRTR